MRPEIATEMTSPPAQAGHTSPSQSAIANRPARMDQRKAEKPDDRTANPPAGANRCLSLAEAQKARPPPYLHEDEGHKDKQAKRQTEGPFRL